jgi:hypothetical protein
MKRILVGVVVLFLLIAAGGAAWWFHWRVPAHASPAASLPAGTLVYIEMPDGAQTWLRYRNSSLRKVMESPEVKELFASASGLGLLPSFPASTAGTNAPSAAPAPAAPVAPGADEWIQALGGASFVACTHLDWKPVAGQKPDPKEIARGLGLIAGFYHAPHDGAQIQALVDRWAAAGHGKAGTATHGGVTYATVDFDPGFRLCHARAGGWDLITLGEPALADFLDRLAAPGKGGADSLAAFADYQKVMARVAPGADFYDYINLRACLDLGAGFMAALPGKQNPAVWQRLQFMHAFAGSLAFRDGQLVHRTAILAPQAERGDFAGSFAPIPLDSLRFTSPSTLFYCAGNLDLEQVYQRQVQAMQAAQPLGTVAANPLAAAEQQFKAQGFDLHENLLRAVGPEAALVIDWPAAQPIPDVLLLFAVKDAAKFDPLYDKCLSLLAPLTASIGKAEPFTAGKFHGLSLTPAQQPKLSPTLFNGPFWGLSLTSSGAQRLLGGAGPAGLARASFALPGGPEHPCGIVYLKTSAVLGQGYAALRPFLLQSGGLDAGALPATISFAPQLGDLRATRGSDGDFLIGAIDSSDGGAGLVLGFASVARGPLQKRNLQRKAPAAAPVTTPLPPVAPPEDNGDAQPPAAAAAPAPAPDAGS